MTHSARWWTIAMALSLPGVAPAVAQDRPVVFVHGLQGTGLGWQPGADYLNARWKIAPIRPTLGWSEVYQTQASNLHAALAGWSSVAAVSHSNGGIVTRQYGRTFGSGSRITQHLAIGSLHQGAALAQNVLNGAAFSYIGELLDAIVSPFQFYEQYDPDWWSLVNFTPIYDAGDLMAVVAQVYARGIAYLGFYPANLPVLPQMVPGSSVFADLNGSTGLAAEATAFSQRISISTQIPGEDVVARMWCGSACIAGRRVLQYYADVMYTYYADHPDPWLQSHAYLWERLWWRMYDFDVVWHALIGSLRYWDGFTAIIWAQDGILPITTATYVNGTSPSIHITSTNIDHFQQRVHTTVFQTIGDVFLNNFGIQRRPPPMAVNISGPQNVTLHQSAQYVASVSGGLAPYTYEWRSRQSGGSGCGVWQDWFSTGTRNYTYASVNGCGISRNELQARVTDAEPSTTISGTYPIYITNPC